MKNKIIIALVAVVAWLGQSCETDPAFDFKDDGKIYFKYPKKINDLGIETDLLVDSIVHTVYGKDLPDGILCGFNYRLWEPVKISTEIIKWSLLPIAVPVRKVWISIS